MAGLRRRRVARRPDPGSRRRRHHRGTVGHLLVLYLEPSLRGQGIGTALLDVVTAHQRAAGATEQWVSVTEGNELGIPFYRARGFAVRDRVPYVVADDGTPEACSLRMSRAL